MAKKGSTDNQAEAAVVSLIPLQFTSPSAFVFPNKENSLKIIEGKKAEYSKLKIDGVDDKDGYEAVKTAMAEMKNTRIALTKSAKENIIDVVNKFAKDFKADLSAIEDALSGVEEELRAKKDLIDTEKERIKTEKALAKQKAIEKRINDLFVIGATLANNCYTFAYDDGLMINSLQIAEFSDEEFGEFLEEVKTAWTVEQDRIEADRLECIRLQQEQDELAETNRKQAEQNKAQATQLNEKRTKLRIKELTLLGFELSNEYYRKEFKKDCIYTFTVDFIESLSDDDWEKEIYKVETYEPPVEYEEPPHPYAGQNTEYFADKPSFNGSSIAEELEIEEETATISQVVTEIDHHLRFEVALPYKDILISERFKVRLYPVLFEDQAINGCTIHNEGELEPGLRWAVIKL